MTTIRLGIGMTSVQSVKPNYVYGSGLSHPPVTSAAALALLRASIPATIPKNAVVTSAVVWFNQFDAASGSLTFTLLRHLAAFKWNVTWNTKPAATTSASQTKSSPAASTWWNIDVTADVQAIIAGTRPNYGWRLGSSSTTKHTVRSQRADVRQPYMLVTYIIPAKVPTNLSPAGGAVSLSKPVVTFTVGDDTTSIQVQVDPAASSSSPAFDSGEVASTTGVLDLSTTSYAGLANGSTTYWRARAKNSNGWSAWSGWVSFSRTDMSAVTLTAPTTTPADGSPPFLWSFAGTQSAWQATLLNANGKVLADSGVVSGADAGWTPSKGLTASGQQGTARIRIWDGVLRIATPSAPAYSEATVNFTVAFDGTVTPMTTLTATQPTASPGVALAGTRATGGIPDEVIVFRNGVQVDRVAGIDMFTSSTAFAWTDWTAPLGAPATYRLAPVVNSAVASGGPTVDITPAGRGLWLIDPDTGDTAVLWGVDEGSWNGDDVATIHVPVSDDATIVRRRLRRGVLTGSISGDVLDASGFTAAATLATLDTFQGNDAGDVYRLIAGHLNIEVIVGDITVTPSPYSRGSDVIAKAQFNFWSA